MTEIIKLDRHLFKLINTDWNNAFFDFIMPTLRHSHLWVPLYLFLLVFVLVNFKKNVLLWILFAVALASLMDILSSHIIKEYIFRLRPCNDNSLIPPARLLLSYKPQSSSFTSSHATNHFAMAMFFYLTLKQHIGRWALLFFLWAGTIIYAQVYVGVHFPLDVLGGAFVGVVFGYLFAYIYNRYLKLA